MRHQWSKYLFTPFLFVFLAIHSKTAPSQDDDAQFRIESYGVPSFTQPIPEASKRADPLVFEWWRKVLTANQFIPGVVAQLRPLVMSRNKLKGRQNSDKEMARLEQEIARLEKERSEFKALFISWLREGNEKSYDVPIPDGPPRYFFLIKAAYTDAARLNKVKGVVVLDAELRADGTVGEVVVVRALPDGLTQQAIYAARQGMFIPEVKGSRFVPKRVKMEFTFDLY